MDGGRDGQSLSELFIKCVEEQNEVKNYVLHKQLVKPKSGVLKILILLAEWAALCFAVGFSIISIFGIADYACAVYPLVYAAGFLCILKSLCKKLVLCYQRYASERTRRKCLCMPTCSEYALAVLNKYCVFKALRMIRIRLFKTCRGGDYKKDFP